MKELCEVDCIIFDGMTAIQMLKPKPSPVKPTFFDLASLFWFYILSMSQGISAVHAEFNRYLENSFKAQTREEREREKKKRRPF